MPTSFRTVDGKIIDISIVRTFAKAGDTMTLLIDRDGNELGTVKGRLHNVLARLRRGSAGTNLSKGEAQWVRIHCGNFKRTSSSKSTGSPKSIGRATGGGKTHIASEIIKRHSMHREAALRR